MFASLSLGQKIQLGFTNPWPRDMLGCKLAATGLARAQFMRAAVIKASSNVP
jgi:hypothetical protein